MSFNLKLDDEFKKLKLYANTYGIKFSLNHRQE